jgi:hypothetical protein
MGGWTALFLRPFLLFGPVKLWLGEALTHGRDLISTPPNGDPPSETIGILK